MHNYFIEASMFVWFLLFCCYSIADAKKKQLAPSSSLPTRQRKMNEECSSLLPPLSSTTTTTTTTTTPLIIGQGGAPNHLPSYTLPSYRLAMELGAHYVSIRLALTQDNLLITVPSVDLSSFTNAALLYEPRLSSSSSSSSTGYYVGDYTLDEIQKLSVLESEFLQTSFVDTAYYDQLFGVPSFQEVLHLMESWDELLLKNGDFSSGYAISALGKMMESQGDDDHHHDHDRQSWAHSRRESPGLYIELLEDDDDDHDENGNFVVDAVINEIYEHVSTSQSSIHWLFGTNNPYSKCHNGKNDDTNEGNDDSATTTTTTFEPPKLVFASKNAQHLEEMYDSFVQDAFNFTKDIANNYNNNNEVIIGQNQIFQPPALVYKLGIEKCKTSTLPNSKSPLDIWKDTVLQMDYLDGISPSVSCIEEQQNKHHKSDNLSFVELARQEHIAVIPYTDVQSIGLYPPLDLLEYLICGAGKGFGAVEGVLTDFVDMAILLDVIGCDSPKQGQETETNGNNQVVENDDKSDPVENNDGGSDSAENNDGGSDSAENNDGGSNSAENNDGESDPVENNDGESDPVENNDDQSDSAENNDDKSDPVKNYSSSIGSTQNQAPEKEDATEKKRGHHPVLNFFLGCSVFLMGCLFGIFIGIALMHRKFGRNQKTITDNGEFTTYYSKPMIAIDALFSEAYDHFVGDDYSFSDRKYGDEEEDDNEKGVKENGKAGSMHELLDVDAQQEEKQKKKEKNDVNNSDPTNTSLHTLDIGLPSLDMSTESARTSNRSILEDVEGRSSLTLSVEDEYDVRYDRDDSFSMGFRPTHNSFT